MRGLVDGFARLGSISTYPSFSSAVAIGVTQFHKFHMTSVLNEAERVNCYSREISTKAARGCVDNSVRPINRSNSVRPINRSNVAGWIWFKWIFLSFLSRRRDGLILFSNSHHSLPSNIKVNMQMSTEIDVKIIPLHSGADTRVPGIDMSDRVVEAERLRDAAVLFCEYGCCN